MCYSSHPPHCSLLSVLPPFPAGAVYAGAEAGMTCPRWVLSSACSPAEQLHEQLSGGEFRVDVQVGETAVKTA